MYFEVTFYPCMVYSIMHWQHGKYSFNEFANLPNVVKISYHYQKTNLTSPISSYLRKFFKQEGGQAQGFSKIPLLVFRKTVNYFSMCAYIMHTFLQWNISTSMSMSIYISPDLNPITQVISLRQSSYLHTQKHSLHVLHFITHRIFEVKCSRVKF